MTKKKVKKKRMDRLTRSEEGQKKTGGREGPPPLRMLSEICSLTGWCKEKGGREGGGGGGGIEQVEAWGERKVNQSGR